MIYKLLGYTYKSKNNNNRIKAAILIQQCFREYIIRKKTTKNKLTNSMQSRVSNSYNIVSIDKHGSTLVFNSNFDSVDSDNDLDWNEDNLYYLQQRKRIKSKIL